MKEISTKPWFCHECHYGPMDAMTCVTDDAKPEEGDVTLCLNCGAVYELDWQLRPRLSKLLNPTIVFAQTEIRKRGRFK
jgi:hypothetical protein